MSFPQALADLTFENNKMASPVSTTTLLGRNKDHVSTHQPIPTMAQIMGAGGLPPQVVVITCADPRCMPESFLGLQMGDAVTIRNAGGNINMALPTVLAIDCLLGLKEIMVVKHTDCGTLAYTDEGVKTVLAERAPSAKKEIEELYVGSIAGKTLEQGLKEQVGEVKAGQLLRPELKSSIRAFVYDLAQGGLTEVAV
ncbi:hypothetical protein LTR97_004329 [Elasticomyces elasticus]|uniref:Carbonic anhydrase n=1 Tax=Elasticomyces elasticus TaxID=574655 RepID=A0AAN7WCS7_9PEZI|nr:hypothetical protein LTR97_004329 [Elasticomyces elasticus]